MGFALFLEPLHPFSVDLDSGVTGLGEGLLLKYLAHVVDHHCPICNKEKPHPTIDPEKCKGCGKCRKNCPMEAISGQIRGVFHIDNEKCIHCGACWGACPFGAIDAIEEE